MAWDVKRYGDVLQKRTGKSVRPYRTDGYVNLINRYGTSKDATEQYFFRPEPPVPDDILEMFYENNGLFAKIIDTPAEEALKHGFKLKDVVDDNIIHFYESALDELDWVETAMTGIKWARLFGGSIAVMLINDGRGLEEPVDWKHIKSIDDIVVYDRSLIQPDVSSLYVYDDNDPFRTRGSRLGTPEWYEITSPVGNFVVHDSRCLTFRNGILPLNAMNEIYQLWGVPEYVRLNRAIRNAEIAHESAPKMLSKSVQPVYKMKDLAIELASEEGEDKVLRRLEAIDMARGLLNSLIIDAEGEDYSFQSFGFAGVQEVIDASCNWLSALTNIPQTILFGRSPAGMNATGKADFENYYNFIQRIQQRMLRGNLRYLLSIIFTAGKHTGEIDDIPEIDVEFEPLWSMTEQEEVQLEAAKIQNELSRAQVAQAYVDMEVLSREEIRAELGKDDPIDPETMFDDMTEDEIMAGLPEKQEEAQEGAGDMGGMMGGATPPMAPEAPNEATEGADASDKSDDDYALSGNSPETAPEATKLPQDMNPEEEDDPDHEDEEDTPALTVTRKEENSFKAPKLEEVGDNFKSWLIQDTDAMTNTDDVNSLDWLDDEIKRRIRGVGVLVVDNNGKILSGIRKGGDGENYGLLGGPGGHIEPGESFEDAAIRETYEEFGIVCKDLTFIALGDYEEKSGLIPAIFLCTEYAGQIHPIDGEMEDIRFREIEDILSYRLFEPFKNSLEILQNVLTNTEAGGIIYSEDEGFVEEDHPRDSNGQFTSGSSSGEKSEEAVRSEVDEIKNSIIGSETQDGIKIKSVSDHAVKRFQERNIKTDVVKNLFANGKMIPGHTENEQCYQSNKYRVVINPKTGNVVTVMRRDNLKGEQTK